MMVLIIIMGIKMHLMKILCENTDQNKYNGDFNWEKFTCVFAEYALFNATPLISTKTVAGEASDKEKTV